MLPKTLEPIVFAFMIDTSIIYASSPWFLSLLTFSTLFFSYVCSILMILSSTIVLSCKYLSSTCGILASFPLQLQYPRKILLYICSILANLLPYNRSSLTKSFLIIVVSSQIPSLYLWYPRKDPPLQLRYPRKSPSS